MTSIFRSSLHPSVSALAGAHTPANWQRSLFRRMADLDHLQRVSAWLPTLTELAPGLQTVSPFGACLAALTGSSTAAKPRIEDGKPQRQNLEEPTAALGRKRSALPGSLSAPDQRSHSAAAPFAARRQAADSATDVPSRSAASSRLLPLARQVDESFLRRVAGTSPAMHVTESSRQPALPLGAPKLDADAAAVLHDEASHGQWTQALTRRASRRLYQRGREQESLLPRPASRRIEGDDAAALGGAWTQPLRDLAPESASVKQALLSAINTHNHMPDAASQRIAPRRAGPHGHAPPVAWPESGPGGATAGEPSPTHSDQRRDHNAAAVDNAQAVNQSRLQLTGRRMASAELLARLAGRTTPILHSADATRESMPVGQPSAADQDALPPRSQPAAPHNRPDASTSHASEAPDRLAHPMAALLRPTLHPRGANRASLLPLPSAAGQPGAQPEVALPEDLDVLAAKIKQILDEEARRHGIDV
jgi:hypothetical protein